MSKKRKKTVLYAGKRGAGKNGNNLSGVLLDPIAMSAEGIAAVLGKHKSVVPKQTLQDQITVLDARTIKYDDKWNGVTVGQFLGVALPKLIARLEKADTALDTLENKTLLATFKEVFARLDKLEGKRRFF
jgi:hypothetical protein